MFDVVRVMVSAVASKKLTDPGLVSSDTLGSSVARVAGVDDGPLLVIVGLFSGSLATLPRAGAWMVWIKKAAGVILLAMAEYYFIKVGQVL